VLAQKSSLIILNLNGFNIDEKHSGLYVQIADFKGQIVSSRRLALKCNLILLVLSLWNYFKCMVVTFAEPALFLYLIFSVILYFDTRPY